MFAAAQFLKWSTGWGSLESTRTFTCLVTCNTVYACHSSTKNTPKHQTAGIMANKISNLNGKVFCVVTVFEDLWCHLFYQLLFCLNPCHAICYLPPPPYSNTPVRTKYQSEVKGKNLRLSFTANNGKSHAELWKCFFFVFSFILYSHQLNCIVKHGIKWPCWKRT